MFRFAVARGSSVTILLVIAAASPAQSPAPMFGAQLVAAGNYHSCALVNARVRCWGRNDAGQLGNGTIQNSPVAVDVVGLLGNVTALVVGDRHSCALVDGVVKCWGRNSDGQLGDGSTLGSAFPVTTRGLGSGVRAIAAGKEHTCAIVATQGLKCWGDGASGMLGAGSYVSSTSPLDVTGLTQGVATVAAGAYHTCAITTAGGAKCWGAGSYGRLGNNSQLSSPVPVDVAGLTTGVASISAGFEFSCAATIAGGAKCWGRNALSQLGDGTLNDAFVPVDVVGLGSGVATVTTGGAHACALTLAGGAKCWGANGAGQVGDGTYGSGVESITPAPMDVVGLTSGVVTLSAGLGHTCAIVGPAGALRCWGGNEVVGTGRPSIAFRAVEVEHLPGATAAIGAGGRTACYPSSLVAGTVVCSQALGAHTCAVNASGGVQCWGENGSGHLGNGTTARALQPTQVAGVASGVTAVALGGTHTCALTSAGAVRCWGANGFGQLGDGTTTEKHAPVGVIGLSAGVIAITAGPDHTCAVTSAGAAKCWGANASGQLGNNSLAHAAVPQDVVGLGTGVARVAAGGSTELLRFGGFSCALTVAGGVKCWGNNDIGQLGSFASSPAATPTDVIGLANGVVAIATGATHGCALLLDGAMKCWGSNGSLQLGRTGIGDFVRQPVDVTGTMPGVTAIAAGGHYTCALTAAGSVQCWGANYLAQLGRPVVGPTADAADVATLPLRSREPTLGNAHGCAIGPDESVRCWGNGAEGQLGNGGASRYPTPQSVVGDNTCAGFSDVDSGSAFCANVIWLTNRAVTLGCDEGGYCPTESVSRLAMAAFMDRLGRSLAPDTVSKQEERQAVDLEFGAFPCTTSSFRFEAQARSLRVDAVLSVQTMVDTSFIAEIVGRRSFAHAAEPLHAAAPSTARAGRWVQVRLIGFLDGAPGEDQVHFAVRLRRASPVGPGVLDAVTCKLRVIVDNRNDHSEPPEP